jgi:hypothetical protein
VGLADGQQGALTAARACGGGLQPDGGTQRDAERQHGATIGAATRASFMITVGRQPWSAAGIATEVVPGGGYVSCK